MEILLEPQEVLEQDRDFKEGTRLDRKAALDAGLVLGEVILQVQEAVRVLALASEVGILLDRVAVKAQAQDFKEVILQAQEAARVLALASEVGILLDPVEEQGWEILQDLAVGLGAARE